MSLILRSGGKGIPGRVNEPKWLELREGEALEGESGSRQDQIIEAMITNLCVFFCFLFFFVF